MDCARRAKIFSPFDALRGFGDAVKAKDIPYVPRPEPDEDTRREIDRRLNILLRLVPDSRRAREKRPRVTVTRFVPCTDKNSPAFGTGGRCVRVTGDVRRVDTAARRSITLDDTEIPFRDILYVEGDGLFDVSWEMDAP